MPISSVVTSQLPPFPSRVITSHYFRVEISMATKSLFEIQMATKSLLMVLTVVVKNHCTHRYKMMKTILKYSKLQINRKLARSSGYFYLQQNMPLYSKVFVKSFFVPVSSCCRFKRNNSRSCCVYEWYNFSKKCMYFMWNYSYRFL